MKRRSLLLALASGGLPLRQTWAQPLKRARIGYLESTPLPGRYEAFVQGLRELGYVDGQNIVVHRVSAGGVLDRLPRLAAELVREKVDVIAAAATPAAAAAMRATHSVPIVLMGVGDPVGSGLAQSLARPGGNVTGTSFQGTEVVGKQLQLLKEAFPGVTRVAVLWNPENPAYSKLLLSEAQSIAPSLGFSVQAIGARDAAGLALAFADMAKGRAGALIVLGDVGLLAHRDRIVQLTAASRLPAIYGASDFTLAGGLMSYAAKVLEQYRRAAGYVDKILRGAKPGDLPIEQPTLFELIVNLGAARALGIAIPQSILLRADRLIE